MTLPALRAYAGNVDKDRAQALDSLVESEATLEVEDPFEGTLDGPGFRELVADKVSTAKSPVETLGQKLRAKRAPDEFEAPLSAKTPAKGKAGEREDGSS